MTTAPSEHGALHDVVATTRAVASVALVGVLLACAITKQITLRRH